MAHCAFNQRLYPLFARVGQALASERRLELLDLLAQGPRHVEALADATDMPVASTSQHLQVLRNARLIEAERQGTKVRYRLAGDDVLRLWLSLRSVAERRLADVGRLTREFEPDRSRGGEVSREEILSLVGAGKAFVIDVRPRLEFESGHLPGAISMPLDELPNRLNELPQRTRIVTYCRGEYCLMADAAVALLRACGFDASRLEGGWPEWIADGRARADDGGDGANPGPARRSTRSAKQPARHMAP